MNCASVDVHSNSSASEGTSTRDVSKTVLVTQVELPHATEADSPTEVVGINRNAMSVAAEDSAPEASYGEEPDTKKDSGGESGAASAGPGKKISRIEELLEMQNQLMLRHLQLTEDGRKEADMVQCLFQGPQDILKVAEPGVRQILKEWRAEFQLKARAFVAQSQVWNRYQTQAANGGLIAPFSDEVSRSWKWPSSYVAIAKPTVNEGVSTQPGKPYDVSDAFAALRFRHAQEAQEFVLAHQKACLDHLASELALPVQTHALLERVSAWAAMHANVFHDQSKAEQLLARQARSFVELVCREEMRMVDIRIKENTGMSQTFLTILRVFCFLVILITPASLGFEHFASLFAVLFALGSGMVLFWEESFLRSARLLLGHYLSVGFLHSRAQPSQARSPWPLHVRQQELAAEVN